MSIVFFGSTMLFAVILQVGINLNFTDVHAIMESFFT